MPHYSSDEDRPLVIPDNEHYQCVVTSRRPSIRSRRATERRNVQRIEPRRCDIILNVTGNEVVSRGARSTQRMEQCNRGQEVVPQTHQTHHHPQEFGCQAQLQQMVCQPIPEQMVRQPTPKEWVREPKPRRMVCVSEQQEIVCVPAPQQQTMQCNHRGGNFTVNIPSIEGTDVTVEAAPMVRCEICSKFVEEGNTRKLIIMTVCNDCSCGTVNRGVNGENEVPALRESDEGGPNVPNLIRLPPISNGAAEDSSEDIDGYEQAAMARHCKLSKAFLDQFFI